MTISKLKPPLATYVLAFALLGCDGARNATQEPPPMAATQSDATSDASAAAGTTSPPIEIPLAGSAADGGNSGAGGRASSPSTAEAGAPAQPKDAGGEPAPDAAPEEPSDAPPISDAMPATEKPIEAPEWPADCEMRYAFLAHGAASPGDTSKYVVPAGSQYYRSFYFAAPWTGEVQILKVRSVVDNRKVGHHWTLYTVDNADASDGEIRGGGNGTFDAPALSDSVGIFSAGPGASDLVMPEGIGLRVPQVPRFALEIHYFNPSDNAEEDRTGVEVCVTTKKRPVEAASHQLGRVNFLLPAHRRTDVTSVCRPLRQADDIHLMAVIPHMHLTGTRFSLILNRASGDPVTLFDEPYAFEEQRSYALPRDGGGADVVMKPGDTLTSVCTYQNDSEAIIASGTRTEDEMCQPLVIAWPAGALSNGLFPTTLVAAGSVGCVEL